MFRQDECWDHFLTRYLTPLRPSVRPSVHSPPSYHAENSNRVSVRACGNDLISVSSSPSLTCHDNHTAYSTSHHSSSSSCTNRIVVRAEKHLTTVRLRRREEDGKVVEREFENCVERMSTCKRKCTRSQSRFPHCRPSTGVRFVGPV